MSGALSKIRDSRKQPERQRSALEYIRDTVAGANKRYWDRQGMLAREGLAQADMGARQVREGNIPMGLVNALLGPVNYVSSPITALVPTQEEIYNAPEIPGWVKPAAAGTAMTAAMFTPGPKVKATKIGEAVEQADDVQRAFTGAASMGEAAQNLPPFTAYHGSPVKGLTVLKPSDRGPFGPATYLSPIEGVASRYGDNLYQATVNPDEIFNGLGSRYFDGDVNGYALWRDQVARVAKASGSKADQVAAVLGKLDPQDGYRAYHDLRRIVGSDAEAQAVLQRAGFNGVSGHVDGPEVAMFGDVNLGQAAADAVPEGITAYHGSPHTFDKFDMSKIGTGEGAQAYGHGLYFAENEAVAKGYRDILSQDKARVDIDGNAKFLVQKFGGDEDYAKMVLRDQIERGDHVRPDTKQRLIDTLQSIESGRYRGGADPAGSMYQVRLNVKPDELLDWDRPLSEQPEGVRGALKSLGIEPRSGAWTVKQTASGKWTAYNVWGEASGTFATKEAADAKALAGTRKHNEGEGGLAYTKLGGNPIYSGLDKGEASAKLKSAGIKGIRYKDAGSRGAEGGTYNYVIFDDKLVDILKRYAIPFTLGAGGAAIVSGQDMPPELAAQMGPEA